jgi:radical SAM protein with 4Fe4S-binding SPASM domain
MTLDEIRLVIGEASGMIDAWSEAYDVAFSRSMNITGGEPLLRPDLYDILEEVRRSGFDIFLLTNGTLLSRGRAQMLSYLGVKGVQVSIEGPEDVHDAIRGKGSFAASAAGIEHLVRAGLSVTLNVTLSRLNASSMEQVISLGRRLGARKVGFSRLVPSGKGRALLSQMLSPPEVKELYTSLYSIENPPHPGPLPDGEREQVVAPPLVGGVGEGVTLVTGDPVASQMRLSWSGDAGGTAIAGCSAGVSGLTILPNGDVLPCRRLPVPIGNARRDSLRELWASSPVLEALRVRDKYKGKCGSCDRWALCRGCRAIAYEYSRSQGGDDYLADDPQCFIEK